MPQPPEVPEEQRGSGPIYPRYEDIVQDGRLAIVGLPQALGMVVFRKLLREHPITTVARNEQGILPVLSRLVIEGGGGPVSVFRRLDAQGRFQLAHTRGADGEVNRLLLNMWAEVHGIAGRTNGPPPANHGAPVYVGRVFGEHVCSRIFAPPGRRKVTRFDVPGLPAVPPDEVRWMRRDALLALPAGATPLDREMSTEHEVAFGLAHTDSNQHVNSLAYPRLFEDAALRRLAAHAEAPLLARYADMAYRKPCFAGERYAIRMQAFRLGDELGAVGSFAPVDGGEPHCYVQMRFAV